jgi:hypothetical protein
VNVFDSAIKSFRRKVACGMNSGLAITKSAKDHGLSRADLSREMSLRSASRRKKLARDKVVVKVKQELQWWQKGQYA